MSLINDALKRTKEAQQQNPPPAGGPPLKPVDPAVTKAAGNSKSLLYIMVACVVVGNAFLFIYLKDGDKKPATIPSTLAPAVATPATAPVSPTPAVTTPSPTPAKPEPAPAVAANPTPVPAPAVIESNAPAASPAIVAQPEPPKPAPLKLQSIIYNPARPSAMVSGKFVFIGDKVQGFRVTAIDQETVTLVGNGQTNVLSLP